MGWTTQAPTPSTRSPLLHVASTSWSDDEDSVLAASTVCIPATGSAHIACAWTIQASSVPVCCAVTR